ncbi:MAG: hypothetical protein ACRCTZ_03825 [Sarcina sp.]
MKEYRLIKNEDMEFTCEFTSVKTGVKHGKIIEVFDIEELKDVVTKEEYRGIRRVLDDDVIGFAKILDEHSTVDCNYLQIIGYEVEEI